MNCGTALTIDVLRSRCLFPFRRSVPTQYRWRRSKKNNNNNNKKKTKNQSIDRKQNTREVYELCVRRYPKEQNKCQLSNNKNSVLFATLGLKMWVVDDFQDDEIMFNCIAKEEGQCA